MRPAWHGIFPAITTQFQPDFSLAVIRHAIATRPVLPMAAAR